jgi:hypothetical protein
MIGYFLLFIENVNSNKVFLSIKSRYHFRIMFILARILFYNFLK